MLDVFHYHGVLGFVDPVDDTPLRAKPCAVKARQRVGKRLLPPMDDRFSARRGTYRIIYRIDDKNRIVTDAAAR